MIRWNNVTKKYGSQLVLRGFDGSLPDTGFVLLMGESGSGKTTFLNILAGLLSFEDGSVSWDGHDFAGRVPEAYGNRCEYVTQDPFFVDHLTVRENLRLQTRSEEMISDILDRFGLSAEAEKYPAQLSGGQKQRLALIRGLLAGKRILLLDEPTASLDGSRKRDIFRLLAQLGSACLIVCATHDIQAVDYADEVYYFDKENGCVHRQDGGGKAVLPDAALSAADLPDHGPKDENKSPILAESMKKQLQRAPGFRAGSLRFLLFLTLALCLVMLGDTPGHKMKASAGSLYGSRVLTMTLPAALSPDQFSEADRSPLETDISYRDSCPLGENIPSDDSGLVFAGPNYDTIIRQLPQSEKAVPIDNPLAYGRYFEKPAEAIVSYEYAISLCPSGAERAIGHKISCNLYRSETVKAEIVGILRPLSLRDCQCLNGAGAEIETDPEWLAENLSSLWFLSAQTVQGLAEDAAFYFDGNEQPQRTWYLFFESTDAMYRYEARQKENVKQAGGSLEDRALPPELSFWGDEARLFLVLAAGILLFTLLFYAQLRRTELVYHGRFISVLEHLGYEKTSVLNCFVRLNLLELGKLYLLATAGAALPALILNQLNRRMEWSPLQLFSFNPALFSVCTISFGIGAFLVLRGRLKTIRTKSWYENLQENRDIL